MHKKPKPKVQYTKQIDVYVPINIITRMQRIALMSNRDLHVCFHKALFSKSTKRITSKKTSWKYAERSQIQSIPLTAKEYEDVAQRADELGLTPSEYAIRAIKIWLNNSPDSGYRKRLQAKGCPVY